MERPFHTLSGPGASEHVVDRSRFLGFARPVDSLDEALAFVADCRSEHHDARHVCYGLRVGHGAQRVDRSNDDGEPSRTGGFPLFQLLEGEELTNAIIAVVRYYGGVKLGTGGLSRAYRECGRLAMQDAGIVTIHPERVLRLTVAYDAVGSLRHWVENTDDVRIADTDYGAQVTFSLAVRAVAVDTVRAGLAELLQRPADAFEFEQP